MSTSAPSQIRPLKAEDVFAQYCLLPPEEQTRFCAMQDRHPHRTPGYAVIPRDTVELLLTDLKSSGRHLIDVTRLLCNETKKLVRRRPDVDAATQEAIRLHDEEGLKWEAIARRQRIKPKTLEQRVRRFYSKQQTPTPQLSAPTDQV